MAIGLGKMMGFSYPANFNYPFTAKSITEFWRRWHISLSTWFKDYVYIPLGGNRKFQIRNILVVWALTGLWHGASWNFVLWGAYFGILLIIEKYGVKKYLDKYNENLEDEDKIAYIDEAALISSMSGSIMDAITIVLIAFSSIVKNSTVLLIIGILVSYLASSIISLLNSLATEEGISSYVAWGFGTFSGVTMTQLPVFASLIVISLVAASLMVKPLNAMLMGTRYATNMGVDVNRSRNMLLLVTGVLTAVVTAFCGPIGFVGMVVPHVARLMLGTSNHTRLLPATMMAGACVALLCTLISVAGKHGVIPINAITPVIGVPIIIYLIVNRRKIQYFN